MNENNARKASLLTSKGQTLNEYPDGILNTNNEESMGLAVGIENGRVVLQFPKPVTWLEFTADDAIEIAVALMKYARRLGLSKTMVMAAAVHVAHGEGSKP